MGREEREVWWLRLGGTIGCLLCVASAALVVGLIWYAGHTAGAW
jgi:hypothetical protein